MAGSVPTGRRNDAGGIHATGQRPDLHVTPTRGSRTVLVVLGILYGITLGLLAFTWITGDVRLQMQLSGLGVTVLYAGCLWHSQVTRGTRSTVVFFGLAAVLSFAAEYVGDNFGWIFGAYHYSGSLGPRLGGVPLLVVLSWGTVVYTGSAIVGWLAGPRPQADGRRRTVAFVDLALVAAGAGLLACAWDLMADPLAVSGLWEQVVGVAPWWSWVDGGPYLPDVIVGSGAGRGIPVSNFVGWWVVPFAVVLLTGLLAPARRRQVRRRVDAVPLLTYGYLYLSLLGGLLEMSWRDPGLVQAVLIGTFAMVPPLVVGALRLLREAGPPSQRATAPDRPEQATR